MLYIIKSAEGEKKRGKINLNKVAEISQGSLNFIINFKRFEYDKTVLQF